MISEARRKACRKYYLKIRKLIPPELHKKRGVPEKPLVERLMEQIVKQKDCWVWTGDKTDKGYGRINVKRRIERAHRMSYKVFKGHIPRGFLVCHHCDNPPCINPEHLFLGTAQDNTNDMIKKGRQNTIPKHQRKITF